MAPRSTRHSQALEAATALIEEIRQLTKQLPEKEDMVLVPAMRNTVMDLHKAVMMLALAECDEESFYRYTDDVFGKLAVMRTYLEMCADLGYMDEAASAAAEKLLAAIESRINLPKKAKLEVVK